MGAVAPHEPEEELLSATDALADAERSEARWQAIEVEPTPDTAQTRGCRPKGMTMLNWTPWEPYDPTWLMELAAQQLQDEPWVPEALSRCTVAQVESWAYIHFVDPNSADWHYEGSLELQSPEHGWIVLDVLRGNRIGGVEFVDRAAEMVE